MSPCLQPAHGKITLASGLRRATLTPSSGSLSLRLRDSHPLASPRNATRRFILQKTRRSSRYCRDILPVHGFRFYFTPLTGVLFAFPSRYSFAIGSRLVFSLGSWSTRIRTGFLVPRPTQVPQHGPAPCFAYGDLTRSGAPFQALRLHARSLRPRVIPMRPYNPGQIRFGLLRVRSPLLAESQLMSVPELLRWFTSLSIAPAAYFIQRPGDRITPAGLPHSEIRGSKDMCSSPRLIAAYHVLHRLTAP